MIVVIDSRVNEPKNVFVFKDTERELANKQYLSSIAENDVHIEDAEHKLRLLEDGLCETAVGYVALWWV